MKTNYHTHTFRCKHAKGSDEEYVLSAIKGGYDILGFSDHTPWPFSPEYKSGIRMVVEQLKEYVESIRYLREKYKKNIKIKIGLECEYYHSYIPWLKEMVKKENIDYLIFGNHYYKTEEKYPYFGYHTLDKEMLQLYMESSIEGMESGLFSYFAHPDLFMRSYPVFDEYCEKISRAICKKASRLNIPLEYNFSCIPENKRRNVTGFPHPAFWKIAMEEKCNAIIGVDAHNNLDLESDILYDSSRKTLSELGIRVIESF